MGKQKTHELIHDFVTKYKVTDGKNFKLSDCDPADTGPFGAHEKDKARELLTKGIEMLSQKQEMLYAQDSRGLLLVFQAMDAAGKDGTIKHVMSGVNPQGCQVFSFKQPSAEELDHDYLWRYMRCLPERGRIGIYNRSYYEEVLVVRVHKAILDKQRLPKKCITKDIWSQRLEDMRNMESYLFRNGINVVKFFLNVSKKEQKKRFLARLDLPEKHWKFSSSDLTERQYWNDYMKAYEDAICRTATKEAPWFVIPADNKWFTRLAVAAAIADTLNAMDLAFPTVSKEKRAEIAEAKAALEKADSKS